MCAPVGGLIKMCLCGCVHLGGASSNKSFPSVCTPSGAALNCVKYVWMCAPVWGLIKLHKFVCGCVHLWGASSNKFLPSGCTPFGAALNMLDVRTCVGPHLHKLSEASVYIAIQNKANLALYRINKTPALEEIKRGEVKDPHMPRSLTFLLCFCYVSCFQVTPLSLSAAV